MLHLEIQNVMSMKTLKKNFFKRNFLAFPKGNLHIFAIFILAFGLCLVAKAEEFDLDVLDLDVVSTDSIKTISFHNETFFINVDKKDANEDLKTLYLHMEGAGNFSKRLVYHKFKQENGVLGVVQETKSFFTDLKKDSPTAEFRVYTAADKVTKCIEFVYERGTHWQYVLVKVSPEEDGKISMSEYAHRAELANQTISFEEFKAENMQKREALWKELRELPF
ncbi:hypothetical protein A11Q_27 [Pseudobdellovibrio exovorus JSS]|uniref:Uncharacterized protein n=2 Tax=Pseudobdellovibrio exovorus TaxID=453816 RepID=M4V4I9_9BACT|nr:hypothetical protein A11Q_27 [Pseudobdellovibrio exovorus JSS]